MSQNLWSLHSFTLKSNKVGGRKFDDVDYDFLNSYSIVMTRGGFILKSFVL